MTHPRGRRPISVNQGPTNGTHYPFVCPSEDVSLLLADAYLSYQDKPCNFLLPFRAAWLHGFGSDAAATPAFAPAPVNSHEILIFDADDRVVFDSTEAVDFAVVDWPSTDPRLKIVEWTTSNAILRVTYHTEFGPNDEVKTYSSSFEPANGQLDARVANRRSPNVNSLRVGITTFGPDEILQLVSGYNVEQAVTAPGPTSADGGRNNTRIVLSAAPGGGKGKFPGCEDPDIVIRRINSEEPQANGNFLFDALDCYSIRQPTSLVVNPDPGPRGPAFLANPTEATLQAVNDCTTCCDCPEFLLFYGGLKATKDRYVALGDTAEEVRDQHRKNSQRWRDQRDCRLEKPCRLTFLPLADRTLSLGAGVCIFGDECSVGSLELKVTFSGPPLPFTVREGTTIRRSSKGSEVYTPFVTDDSISVFFESVDPGFSNSFTTIIDFASTGTLSLLLEAILNESVICTINKATNILP